MVRSPQPRPEDVEQFAGGFFIEDEHAQTHGVRVKLNIAVDFGADQWREIPRTAVCRARDVNNPAIRVAATRLARIGAAGHQVGLHRTHRRRSGVVKLAASTVAPHNARY
jgi:hypothetical protein